MAIDDTLLSWLLVLQSVELVFILVSILLGSLAAKVVTSNHFFHPNLYQLLRTVGIFWFLFTLARVASLIDQFVYPESMSEFLGININFFYVLDGNYFLIKQWPHVIFEVSCVFFAAQGAACVVLIICERIFASIYLENYEHQRHTALTYFFIVAAMPIAAFMSFFGKFFTHFTNFYLFF
jgi:hypothetical protein